MLQITDAAVDALKTIREQGAFQGDADVRIQLVEQEGEHGIGLSFEDPPQDTDERLTETGDMGVFVAQELVGPLGSAVLDIEQTDDGAALTLREQGGDGHDHEGHEHHDH